MFDNLKSASLLIQNIPVPEVEELMRVGFLFLVSSTIAPILTVQAGICCN